MICRLEGEIRQLVIQHKAVDHDMRAKGAFDTGGETDDIAIIVNDNQMAGRNRFELMLTGECQRIGLGKNDAQPRAVFALEEIERLENDATRLRSQIGRYAERHVCGGRLLV